MKMDMNTDTSSHTDKDRVTDRDMDTEMARDRSHRQANFVKGILSQFCLLSSQDKSGHRSQTQLLKHSRLRGLVPHSGYLLKARVNRKKMGY